MDQWLAFIFPRVWQFFSGACLPLSGLDSLAGFCSMRHRALTRRSWRRRCSAASPLHRSWVPAPHAVNADHSLQVLVDDLLWPHGLRSPPGEQAVRLAGMMTLTDI